MLRAYPQEIQEDIIRTARTGDAPFREAANGFAVAESRLCRWAHRTN